MGGTTPSTLSVWLVWSKTPYDGDYLWGVYATQRRAERAIENARQRGVNVSRLVIDEQEVTAD